MNKKLLINESQFKNICVFDNNYQTFMSEAKAHNRVLNEGGYNQAFKATETCDFYSALVERYAECGNNIGAGIILLEGALELGIPAKLMLKEAEGLGVPPNTKKNMIMGYYQKLDRTDGYLNEEVLNEGVMDYLSKLLKGKTGDMLKKHMLALVMAGKLSMVSTGVLADVAHKMDSTIDPAQFQTEIEAASKKAPADATATATATVGAEAGVLTPEAKKQKLSQLEETFITTTDNQNLVFKFTGNMDNIDGFSQDNYPMFKPNTPEFNAVKVAFDKASKTGEGIVTGKCTFKRNGSTKVFDGQFVQANGLYYGFTKKDSPVPTKTPEPTPTAEPTPTNVTQDPAVGRENGRLAMDDFTGLYQGAKHNYDYLKQRGKAPADFMSYLCDFMRKNDERLAHLSNDQLSDLFENGFKINIHDIPALPSGL